MDQHDVMTASPERLTLMLYEGAIKFMKKGIVHIEQKEYAEANATLLRSQDIMQELMGGLDMDHEISNGLYSLYDYVNFTLAEANAHKETARVEQAIGLVEELKATWIEAMAVAKS